MTLVHLAILLGAVAATLGTSTITGIFGSSARAQALTALVLSLVLGVAAAARQGALDHLSWHNTATVTFAAGVVYSASQVAFHGLWKPTNAASWLETLVGPRAAATLSRDEKLAASIGRAVAAAIASSRAPVTSVTTSPAPAQPAAAVTSMYALTPPDQAPVGQAAAPAVQTLP